MFRKEPAFFTSVLVLVLYLITACFFTPLMAQEKEVIARGVGAILGGDEAKAEDDALANAFRNAIEQVLGTLVQSDVLVQNYQVVEDNIYTRTQGYIQSYQVISKSKRGDNILEVTIKAVVKEADLQSDLEAIGLLMSRKGKPRLMILVDEVNMDEHFYSYSIDLNTTETELMNAFMEKGFPFVDRDVVLQKLKKDAILSAVEGNEQAAQQIAQEAGAEILIIGKAIAKPASGGPSVLQQAGMVSCQAMVNLRAVRSDDGRVIATSSQTGAAAHIDQMAGGTEALKKAARLASDDLISKILKAWQRDVYTGTTVQLRVLDVANFSDLVKFKNMIKTYVRGVQNIYQREFSNGTALLDIEMSGNASKLAEELSLKDFSPYSVNILNVTQNAVIVKLVNQNQ